MLYILLFTVTILTASQSASHREEVKKMRIFLTHGDRSSLEGVHRTLGLHPGLNIWNPDVRKTSFRRFAQVGKNVHHNNKICQYTGTSITDVQTTSEGRPDWTRRLMNVWQTSTNKVQTTSVWRTDIDV